MVFSDKRKNKLSYLDQLNFMHNHTYVEVPKGDGSKELYWVSSKDFEDFCAGSRPPISFVYQVIGKPVYRDGKSFLPIIQVTQSRKIDRVNVAIRARCCNGCEARVLSGTELREAVSGKYGFSIVDQEWITQNDPDSVDRFTGEQIISDNIGEAFPGAKGIERGPTRLDRGHYIKRFK